MINVPKHRKKPSAAGHVIGKTATRPRARPAASQDGQATADARQHGPLSRPKEKPDAAHRNRNYSIGKAGLIGSLLTILKGTANACAGIPANPLVIGLGIGLTIASLIWLLWSALG